MLLENLISNFLNTNGNGTNYRNIRTNHNNNNDINNQYNYNNIHTNDQNKIIFYYKNNFSPTYKKDERILKQIIHKNVTPTNPINKIVLRIYYTNYRSSQMIMKNNCNPPTTNLQKTHVIYLRAYR